MNKKSTYTVVNIDQLKPHPKNKVLFKDLDPEEINELAVTIEETGLIQPITVCPDPNDNNKYIILGGHQRIRALRLLGIRECNAIVYPVDPESPEAEKILIIENVHRRHLSPMEIKKSIRRLEELGLNKSEIADTLGMTVGYIYKINSEIGDPIPELSKYFSDSSVKILSHLPKEVQEDIVASVELKISSAELDKEKLKQQLEETKEEWAHYVRKATDYKRERDKFERMMNKRKQERIEKEKELIELQRRLKETQEQLKEAIKKAETSNNSKNNEDISKLQQQIESLQSEIEQKEIIQQQLEDTISEIREQYELMKKKYENKEQEIKDAILKTKEEIEDKVRRETQEELERKYKKIISDLESQLKKMKREITQEAATADKRISSYYTVCVAAAKMAQIFIGQLEEIKLHINSKANKDPDSFKMISPALVRSWCTNLDVVISVAQEVQEEWKAWHRINK